jgi:murein DD-endopeptidase MepM/ murein hydrolase activator NlpD
MLDDLRATARDLRERLAAHAAGHIDDEREAVELVELADRLLRMLAPAPALKLVWPTDYRVYTQKFGERPEYYSRFGLPGHEGVDIRAPNGSNVYACADGVVTMAGWHPSKGKNHPYGVQVRILHSTPDGAFETMYAHMQDGSVRIRIGQEVKAGQPIGLADTTGNTSAAHLHLSLKKVGLKNDYGGMIDPEPYFIEGPGR